MSVWARNEQRRLVRIVSPRDYEKSIISQVFQDNILSQMDHPGNQKHVFCHTPNPSPTRLADPNRFPGRETQD